MRISIAELSANSSGAVRTANEIGSVDIVNARRRGSPTEAMVVSSELWAELLRLPGAKKRVREFTATKQADQSDELPEVA